MSLGEVGWTEEFGKSNTPVNKVILWITFIVSIFVLVTHMLNMLIGIMGDSRSKYREVET